jgi:16S rRNA (adenine1518-N6/adenine1519-N6)-dimethyltransferase
MLRQSLKALTPEPGILLAAAGLVETARAEEIPVAGFVDLANRWDAHRKAGTAGAAPA